MASRIIPGMSLRAFWALGESGWKVGMDENIWRLSFLAQSRIFGVVDTLPVTPEEGDRYILDDSGSPYDQHIMVYDQALWVPITPEDRFVVFNTENDSLMYFNEATNAWVSLISPEAIKEAYESNDNTNQFTDDEKAKLADIENDATGDMSAEEIKAAYESNPNTNAFTDAEKAKLSSLSSSRFLGVYPTLSNLQAAHPAPAVGSFAYVDVSSSADIMSYIWDANSTKYVPQASGNTQETPESIKEKYEVNDDTNAFTDAYKAQLDGLDDALDGKQPAGTYLVPGAQIPWTDVTGKPTFFSGDYADLTGKPALFDGTWGSLSGKPISFPPSTHTHAYGDLTGLPTLFSGAWADISGKPSTFTPSAHGHDAATTSIAGFMSAADKEKLDNVDLVKKYHINLFIGGLPKNDELLVKIKTEISFEFPDDFVGSIAHAEDVATANSVFTVSKNGITVGTVTFLAGTATGVFASTGSGVVSYAEEDVFKLVGQGIADATLKDISISFKGVQS
jgi:hypothetical protein